MRMKSVQQSEEHVLISIIRAQPASPGFFESADSRASSGIPPQTMHVCLEITFDRGKFCRSLELIQAEQWSFESSRLEVPDAAGRGKMSRPLRVVSRAMLCTVA